MAKLNDFRTMELIDQIQILEGLTESKDMDVIPELIELYEHPLDDETVNFMIRMKLREFMGNDEEKTVSGLKHPNMDVRKLCVQVAGQHYFKSSIPILCNMVTDKDNEPIFQDLFNSMAELKAPEFQPIVKDCVTHPKKDIASIAIKLLGDYQDTDSIEILCKVMEDGETDENYMECDLTTGAAINALANIPGEKALAFLASKICYRNPTGRMIVHEELIQKGSEIIPFIEKLFKEDNDDMKIMTANIIGAVGEKKGGEVLISAVDRGLIINPNVKYAVYEALGKIPFMKGIVFLMDGLSETDELILVAVISSLNNCVNPGIVKKITELIRIGNDQSERLIKNIITSKALNIFEFIYKDNEISGKLINAIIQSKDQELKSDVKAKLVSMGAEKDSKMLSTSSVGQAEKKVLAVDDSKAMLAFYRNTVSAMGLGIETAENGKKASALVELGGEFDLIITDMNMPEMDGIAFTRKVRNNSVFKTTPIIMVSTESEQSQVKLAEEAGVDSFLTKPFTQDILEQKIKKFIDI